MKTIIIRTVILAVSAFFLRYVFYYLIDIMIDYMKKEKVITVSELVTDDVMEFHTKKLANRLTAAAVVFLVLVMIAD